MVGRRILVISVVAAIGLSGCVAQELKMPWDRSAPPVESPAQPQAKPVPQPSRPSVPEPVLESVTAPPPQKESEAPRVVAAPAQEAQNEAAVSAPVEAAPVLPASSAPTPSAVVETKSVEPQPATEPAPAPQVAPTPVDPMDEMRDQARVAAQSGEAEVAEALWQLILQTAPDDSEAQEALAALEQAKLNKAKADGKVILLGEKSAGWVVQVATYRADGREQAFEWLGKIRRAGYKPFLKTVEFPGRTLYRLRLGAYPERWMAEEVERRLLNNFPNEGLRPRIMQQDD
jgi:hypothetical protein